MASIAVLTAYFHFTRHADIFKPVFGDEPSVITRAAGNDLHLLRLIENVHRLLAESLFKDTISGQATFKHVRNSSGLFMDLFVHVMRKLAQFDVAARLAAFPHKPLYGIAECITNRASTVSNIGNVTVLHHDVPASH